MSYSMWRLCLREFRRALSRLQTREPGCRTPGFRVPLEELESRLAPASYAVNAQLEVSRLDNPGDVPAHAVVFFESGVADYQVLRQGLVAGTDSVLLDNGGDGLREMAAFLASSHDLTSVGVVAHGSPGAVALGSATLDARSLSSYTRELAVLGSALGPNGELDLWSCDVALGLTGAALVEDLAVATGAGVAAAEHTVGSVALDADWELDVKAGGARGKIPFSADALGAFHQLLGTWGPAASLATARGSQAAVLLESGQVLVMGGFDTNNNPLSSAEIYDPASGTWSAAASMATGRVSETATLLPGGKVLVTGGNHGTPNPLASAELYDPVSNTWSPAGAMAEARYLQTATLLQSGKVLVTGGFGNNGFLNTAELYDPANNTWSTAGAMATGRAYHTATLLGNGKVLVVGGHDNNGDTLSSAELYDPTSNTWSAAGSLAAAREYHTATLLVGGKVLVAGGRDSNFTFLSSAELYDPVTNMWSPAGSLATARYLQTATLLASNMVLVAGGSNGSGAFLASAELYDPVSSTWSAAGSMATARFTHTATLLQSGKVLVAGGYGSNGFLSSAELYDAGVADWSKSTISVTPATIPVGGTAMITLTAKDSSGNPATSGGLAFTFGLGSGTGSGTFSNLTDNNNGTYTATFTGTTPGPITITATLAGQAITSNLPTVTVTAPAVATQLAITNLSATSVTAGGAVTFTVTAEDSTGHIVPGYTGAVQLTSTDAHALFGGNSLPAGYTFVANDNGSHTFTVTLETPGTQTITVTDTVNHLFATSSPITVAAAFSKFVVSVPGGKTAIAGSLFVVTVQASDQSGNPVNSYSGPSTITITTTRADPQSSFPITGTLSSSGFGVFLVTLKTAGSYTFTATAGSFSGTSDSVTITAAGASYFSVTSPATATTGNPFNVTVTALDRFGNLAAGYNGHVHFTSKDAGAILPADSALASGQGTFSVKLETSGSQTITATDNLSTSPTITGTSGAITTRGLVVTSFTPTATGFTASFSKPVSAADLSLYGAGLRTVQDVTLVGAASGPITGTLLIDPSSTSITFKATQNSLTVFLGAPVLPNDTYTVSLASGSGTNGFLDALGAGLDGANNGGHANYTTTFTTNSSAKAILSIPDFARGPDGTHTIKVPNDTADGIPVTLLNASNVKDVTFVFSYNPSLLAVTGAGTGDASAAGSTFTLLGNPTAGTATFSFHNNTPQSGTVVLGDILANVPDSAANLYKSKELLTLSSITVNGAPFTGAVANGVHVNAYFGDVTGNGTIDGLDVATASTVARGNATGFAAYPLLDPAIVGDVANDIAVDAGDVSDLAAFTVHLPTSVIPAIPTGLTIIPSGPDPTLSLVSETSDAGRIGNPSGVGRISNPSSSGTLSVKVMLDNPHPAGSMGMTEAVLALSYDPSVLSVSPADITLGSIPGLGVGWQLTSEIDQATGQIGIILYSTTPITTTQAGSLVNIAFHVKGGGPSDISRPAIPTSVQLLNWATPGGQQFITQVDDAQGQLVLSHVSSTNKGLGHVRPVIVGRSHEKTHSGLS